MVSDTDGPLSLAYVEGLLKLLREAGVASYRHGGLMIELGAPPEAVPDEPEASEEPTEDDLEAMMWNAESGGVHVGNNIFDNPNLYTSGQAPRFPKPGQALPRQPQSEDSED